MERLLDRVVQDPETGCWLWLGVVDRQGRGQINLGGRTGRTAYTHRVTYQDWYGETSLGLDHLCHVRHCCNPDHLEPVSQRERFLRSAHPLAQVARSGVCPKGHFMTGPNLIQEAKGRRCRTCLLDWRRTKYAELRASGLANGEATRRR